jgi:tetratricopeptide (TPR) repeat protein
MRSRLAPGNPDNLNSRGYSLVKLAQYDRAIADFNAALKLKPDHFDALRNRGWAYWLQGDLNRAIADYDAALKLDPDDTGARSDRRAVGRHGRDRPLDRGLRQDPCQDA